MSQTMLLVLLSAAAVISAALSFLAWARLARPPARATAAREEAEPEATATAEETDAETDDMGDEQDDRDTAT